VGESKPSTSTSGATSSIVPAIERPDSAITPAALQSWHLAGAEFGAGVFFDPVDPRQAAAEWRSA